MKHQFVGGKNFQMMREISGVFQLVSMREIT